MLVDLTLNAIIALAMPCAVIAYAMHIGTKRSTAADATRIAWQAWEHISDKALDKGQPVPPPPSE